jgi:type IX secretion system PorP/SprF family membrane protein
MKRTFLILISVLYLQNVLVSQDIHFSNFYSTPLIINPANTGNYIGDWRISTYTRQQKDQGIDVYKTSMLAFDMPVYYYQQMGSIGLIYIHDNSSSNTLLVNKLFLSLAHFIKISANSYLHMGFQIGLVHKKISDGFLSLPDQFDMGTGYFNPNMPTQEVFEKNKFSYLDLNWGVIWSRKTKKVNSEIGLAMFHYNKPEENFLGIRNQLPPRYLIHGFFEINVKNNLYCKPKLLYTNHNKSDELLIGQDIGIRIENAGSKSEFYIGCFYRAGFGKNQDAMLFKTGFDFKSISLGICYDFELPNKNKNRFSKIAFEACIQYTRPSTNLKNKVIPCETF